MTPAENSVDPSGELPTDEETLNRLYTIERLGLPKDASDEAIETELIKYLRKLTTKELDLREDATDEEIEAARVSELSKHRESIIEQYGLPKGASDEALAEARRRCNAELNELLENPKPTF